MLPTEPMHGVFWRGAGAAAEHPRDVGAVVSRGGRPDLASLASNALARLHSPTLLIVGSRRCYQIERAGQAPDTLRGKAGDRSRRYASLRRTGYPGACNKTGRRLVRASHRPYWNDAITYKRTRSVLGTLKISQKKSHNQQLRYSAAAAKSPD